MLQTQTYHFQPDSSFTFWVFWHIVILLKIDGKKKIVTGKAKSFLVRRLGSDTKKN